MRLPPQQQQRRGANRRAWAERMCSSGYETKRIHFMKYLLHVIKSVISTGFVPFSSQVTQYTHTHTPSLLTAEPVLLREGAAHTQHFHPSPFPIDFRASTHLAYTHHLHHTSTLLLCVADVLLCVLCVYVVVCMSCCVLTCCCNCIPCLQHCRL